MRKLIYILLSALPIFCFGQNKINDSLGQVLLLNQSDTHRVDALNTLSSEVGSFFDKNFDKFIHLVDMDKGFYNKIFF